MSLRLSRSVRSWLAASRVSNLFEVQSGRTHLIDPAANALRVTEVAQALGAVDESTGRRRYLNTWTNNDPVLVSLAMG